VGLLFIQLWQAEDRGWGWTRTLHSPWYGWRKTSLLFQSCFVCMPGVLCQGRFISYSSVDLESSCLKNNKLLTFWVNDYYIGTNNHEKHNKRRLLLSLLLHIILIRGISVIFRHTAKYGITTGMNTMPIVTRVKLPSECAWAWSMNHARWGVMDWNTARTSTTAQQTCSVVAASMLTNLHRNRSGSGNREAYLLWQRLMCRQWVSHFF
jgi:hypothetical protein